MRKGSGVSLLGRLTTTLSAKVNELLDRLEDPGEALDYAYQRLFEQLGKARQAIAHLASARQHLVLQSAELEEYASELESQAREAVKAGRDDLAREALARRSVIKSGVASLAREGDEFSEEEERFIHAAGLLQSQVEILGARKEAMKASYAVTGSKAEIDDAISKIKDDVAKVSVTVRRAEEKSAQLRAQSKRIDALLVSGALRDLASTPESIAAELREARGSEDVERQLATMKRGSRG
ncbi:MAG TPA: PspA/IM30 family protein [Acidimicrobiales bacterium]|nr:PspA/IM30 family protein [Acidimicrobiales bacterium]